VSTQTGKAVAFSVTEALRADEAERRAQAHLLREVIGNPFRPVEASPTWLGPEVTALATIIYEERAFHQLPALADALEKAGCTELSLLDHCRSAGPHVRGCWAMDLCLGKR
jgi:hypothetical protein